MITTLTTLLLTGVIAASTVVYTIYSIRLWKATRLSADISRYTLFMGFIMELDRQVRLAKLQHKPDAAALEQFERMLIEHGFKALLGNINLKKNPELAQYLAQFDGMLRTSNLADASWLRQVIQNSKQ